MRAFTQRERKALISALKINVKSIMYNYNYIIYIYNIYSIVCYPLFGTCLGM